jgi:hypothetical protein
MYGAEELVDRISAAAVVAAVVVAAVIENPTFTLGLSGFGSVHRL